MKQSVIFLTSRVNMEQDSLKSKFSAENSILVLMAHSQCRAVGLIPGQGTKIPHAEWVQPKNK